MEKVIYNMKMSKIRLDELKIVSANLDLSVASLVKMGITLILKKYKHILMEANEK